MRSPGLRRGRGRRGLLRAFLRRGRRNDFGCSCNPGSRIRMWRRPPRGKGNVWARTSLMLLRFYVVRGANPTNLSVGSAHPTYIHRWTTPTISKFYATPFQSSIRQPCAKFGLLFGGHGVIVLRRGILSVRYIRGVASESFAERSGDVGEG